MEALLISEEALILLEENAPEDALINVSVKKHMGIPRIKIFVPGEALMLDEYADSITHRHSRGINRVTITTGIPERVLTAYTISAIALAVFVSIACSMFRFEGFSNIGKNGKSVVTSYAVTSVIAALIGLACFFIFQPG